MRGLLKAVLVLVPIASAWAQRDLRQFDQPVAGMEHLLALSLSLLRNLSCTTN